MQQFSVGVSKPLTGSESTVHKSELSLLLIARQFIHNYQNMPKGVFKKVPDQFNSCMFD